ncbi:hypothetical protein FOCG_18446 [Fusarium oxysporum f. sp. radicis-lycopersici 26381]|nr:hypothetical protein FOCG_18446 [Fusarium oxysporum f. sp. radicis-lycopersici 26381]
MSKHQTSEKGQVQPPGFRAGQLQASLFKDFSKRGYEKPQKGRNYGQIVSSPTPREQSGQGARR